MSDQYQTTNAIIGPLNADDKILARGEIDIAITTAVGSLYFGQGSVLIPKLQGPVANPTFEYYRYVDNGAPTYSRSLAKGPRVARDLATGDIIYSDSGFLFWEQETKEGEQLELIIQAWSTTQISQARYFYTLFNQAIADSNLFET